MTNCDLLSKYSDLQVEFINLLKKIAQIETEYFQETGSLENAFEKYNNENYEMSLTDADLILSNVECRRETIQLRKKTIF